MTSAPCNRSTPRTIARFNTWFDRTADGYKRVIGWALDHRLALAGAVGYQSAGTCEFLLDRDGRYYFLDLQPGRSFVEYAVSQGLLPAGPTLLAAVRRRGATRMLKV